MTRVDFYVSPNQASDADLQLACRIADKAWQQQNRVYIRAASRDQARALDDLLWIFRDGAFLPHCLDSAGEAEETPILIGCDDPPATLPEVMINLAREVPGFFSRFGRVVEIVAGDDTHRNLARERFRFYRDRGYPLETHELSS